MFPIQHDDIWKMYQKHVDLFWRPEEIDLIKDVEDWKSNDTTKTRVMQNLKTYLGHLKEHI
jgi:ribonucleotide reductase beta subunit family protein with ferritin-like domain